MKMSYNLRKQLLSMTPDAAVATAAKYGYEWSESEAAKWIARGDIGAATFAVLPASGQDTTGDIDHEPQASASSEPCTLLTLVDVERQIENDRRALGLSPRSAAMNASESPDGARTSTMQATEAPDDVVDMIRRDRIALGLPVR